MRGRLNYIELRVVTQCIYERVWRMQWGNSGGRGAERRSGIYSTTFWLRLILKNRHRQKLRAHPRAYVLARARSTIFICPTCSPFRSASPFLSSLPVIALALVILNPLCRCFPEEIYGRKKRRRIILARRLSLCMLKLRIKSDILK